MFLGSKPLTSSAKTYIFDVWKGFEYASAYSKLGNFGNEWIKLAKQVTKKLKRMSIDMFSWSQEKLFEKCCKFPKHPHGSVLLKLNRKIQLLNLIFKLSSQGLF